MSESPAPLVPVDVDLRGLEYMPFFGNHLFGSDFNAGCSDAEWRAGLTLWWAAWNQVPASSLPNDDVALTRLADLGRDVRGFRRLKEKAMRGFVLCTDGRLYHRFIAKQALVAWDKRVKEREKKRKWREEQDRKRLAAEGGQQQGRNRDGDRDKGGDGTADGNRRDVTGRDGTIEKQGKDEVGPEPDASLSRVNGHDHGKTRELRRQALEVLIFLNEKTGRAYQPVPANVDMIVARLKDGATVDDLRAVVAKKCREWTCDEKMAPYLRPATLFNRTKFAQYQGELAPAGRQQ